VYRKSVFGPNNISDKKGTLEAVYSKMLQTKQENKKKKNKTTKKKKKKPTTS